MLGDKQASPESLTLGDLNLIAKSIVESKRLERTALISALSSLQKRVNVLSNLWEFMGNQFPTSSLRAKYFREINSKIREAFYSCLSKLLSEKNETRQLQHINEAHLAITKVIHPEINKRVLYKKPIHYLLQHKALTDKEEKEIELCLAQILKEGANLKDKTMDFPQTLLSRTTEALTHLPWVGQIVTSLFTSKKEAFATSQSPKTVEKVLKKHPLVYSKHVLHAFTKPKKEPKSNPHVTPLSFELVELHQELLGQEHLKPVHDYLLGHDTNITGQFFKILANFQKFQYYQITNNALTSFFQQYGIADIAEAFFNVDQTLNAITLKTPFEKQMLCYLLVYLYQFRPIDQQGKIVARVNGQNHLYSAQMEVWFQVLESVGFLPAYYLHQELDSVARDENIKLKICSKGALLGNAACRYDLCRSYFGYITESLTGNPPAFYFPKGISHEQLIEWAKSARDEGFTDGLSNIQHFMENVFLAIRGLYEEKTSPELKTKIREAAKLVKEISGDNTINRLIDKLLTLQGTKELKISKYDFKKDAALKHIQKDYTDKFKRKEAHVEKLLELKKLPYLKI